jgi:hypothetical protein
VDAAHEEHAVEPDEEYLPTTVKRKINKSHKVRKRDKNKDKQQKLLCLEERGGRDRTNSEKGNSRWVNRQRRLGVAKGSEDEK